MALVITGFGDRGILSDERVGFRVSATTDLKFNIVFATSVTETGFYNRSSNSYWFAPENARVGDRVVLYTKSGADSFQTNDDGTKTYFRYWGLPQAIYTAENKGIVIAKVDNWSLSTGV
jgi:hypothetical protein